MLLDCLPCVVTPHVHRLIFVIFIGIHNACTHHLLYLIVHNVRYATPFIVFHCLPCPHTQCSYILFSISVGLLYESIWNSLGLCNMLTACPKYLSRSTPTLWSPQWENQNHNFFKHKGLASDLLQTQLPIQCHKGGWSWILERFH